MYLPRVLSNSQLKKKKKNLEPNTRTTYSTKKIAGKAMEINVCSCDLGIYK